MGIKLSVGIKYSDQRESIGVGLLTARRAFLVVRYWSNHKGFEYADVLPILDGEALLESRFKVERGDNVNEKFAGYYQEKGGA